MWTHLAGVYDAAEHTLALYVNGILQDRIAYNVTMGDATGPLLIGASDSADWDVHFQGEIADVQVFDRVLVGQDFTGQLKTDPYSGGFDEPGIVSPIEVGRWDFDAAVPCYLADLENTCEAPDGTGFDRWLALTRGSAVENGNRGSALSLDGNYFPEENPEPWEATQEYGRSAYKTGLDTSGPDPLTIWEETPVLRTDQSFTVSAWTRPDVLFGGNMTAVAQKGVEQSAFMLSTRHFTVNGEPGYRYAFSVWGSDDDVDRQSGTAVSRPLTEDDLGEWVHLVGVYDAATTHVKLYLNGELVDLYQGPSAFQASGPLLVGAAWWSPLGEAPRLVDRWQGAIDDVHVFQGAMTDAQIRLLFEEQSADPES